MIRYIGSGIRQMKLKHLLILAFITMSAVPLFFGLNYLNNISGHYARDQFAHHLSSMSKIAEQRILTAVDRIKDNTALISSRTQMRISLEQWNQTGDISHQEKITRIINDAKNGLTHLKDIRIYDRRGRPVASTTDTSINEKLDIQGPLRAQISLVPEADEIIALSREPLRLNHETVGYIEIRYYTNFITSLVRDRTGLGKTGEWLFAVRHESGDALFAVPLKYDHQAAFQRRVSKDRLDVPITQALLGNERIMSEAPDYLEQPVLASTRYIPELDWGLVAKVNETEVNQLASQNQSLIYIAELIIVVIAIGVGVALAFYISRPIERLKTHTARAASGKLEPPQVQPTSWQEAKELTNHFAYMIKAIRELTENLQQKVDERTQELNEANKKLEKIASHDQLTGLYNRRQFDQRFAEEFDRNKRYRHGLAVALLDIDHFKSINDRYGHAVGDDVLRKIGAYLNSSVRASDVAARIGGEEFCLLLPECTAKGALAFLERIRNDISEIEVKTNDISFNITCSVGVAYLDASIEDKNALLNNADMAMYKAKQGGRNKVMVFHDGHAATPIDKYS
ncbi:sensor domain-containing diguanylate cyclase [Halomonas maura]|uniref:sensor domain-containing diguanylate cyclase n=1 Tax=Halomonas maura TaxID=117606 RepID=UPI0025B5E34A|nr:diguanylate cyclase [Halomonas maura]MDN3554960.1 diguanylate cyclase [Halomonas maura]